MAPAAPAAPAVATAVPPAVATAVLPPPPAAMPPVEAPPYSAAVAARFPDPAVRYDTPGLAAGRSSFSTQAEIRAWLQDVATAPRRGAIQAAVLSIGRAQSSESIDALVLTTAAGTDPAALLASGRPTVLLIGQQHGDEPAGAEALLVTARSLTQGALAPVLAKVNVVLVPRANPDGALAGRRVTANGADMNRDHLLLTTPEARAVAALARDYQPAVVVDAHEYTVVGRFLQKYGAIQRFDALLQYATTANLAPFLTRASEEWFRLPLVQALRAQGLSSEWYYTTSTDIDDKRISMGGTLPDNGRNVYGLRNTVSLLVETRGVGIGRLHIQRRVHTHVTALSNVLQSTAQRAADLQQLRSFVARDIAAMACRSPAVIEAGPTPQPYQLLMLDPETGADRSVAVEWNSSLQLRSTKVRERPCGYWLSPSAGLAVERLRMLGVQVFRIGEQTSLLGQRYRETARSAGARQDVRGTIADGNATIVRAEVELVSTAIDAPAGSYYVPVSQALANVILAALEPDTQSSYFANRILDSLDAAARVTAVPSVRLDEML